MFKSVLIANRGEIACRIARTAQRMGVRSIAVYSDADAKAKHVREADLALHIGAAAASESYLRGDRILAAAKESGAEAIHPGYGFLSENPDFAQAVMDAGLIWIGPTPDAIRAMGLKDEAKRIAIEAGVPVLAGYQGEDQSEKRLLKAAKDIGFPVLIKAVAGGGGRGIREVKSADQFADSLASARREAKAAFGNDAVLIEKLVERPRHIEVQVFGDAHGNLVHLFERDCSLQRRRQKVIEEAPAPGMTDEVRAAMTDAALKVARAVSYQNAGTVEFIVDGVGPLRTDGFWFLEMNTRLQVEHPVTEAITGLDLVEWQFRVAAGERLPKAQADLAINGHAIEARICAEDPAEGFRPSVGRIETFKVTRRTGHGLRTDAGFEAGDTVPSAYDSLIAKAIVWGTNRARAIKDLAQRLDGQIVTGVKTNTGFLWRCLHDEGFVTGDLHTGVIADRGDALTTPSLDARKDAATVAAHAILYQDEAYTPASPWAVKDAWRLNAPSSLSVALECDGVVIPVRLDRPSSDFPPNAVTFADGRIAVALAGETYVFATPGASAELHAGETGDDIKAPLPGKIVTLAGKVGDAVKRGDALLTLEAMKMEHALKAPRDGVILEIAAGVGDQVKEGVVLVRLTPEEV